MSQELLEKEQLDGSSDFIDDTSDLTPDKKPNIFKRFFGAVKRFFTSRAGYITVSAFVGFFFVLAITLFPVASWYKLNYAGVKFKDLVMILTAPKEGTDTGLVTEIMSVALPYTITAAALYIEAVVLLAHRKKICRYLRGVLCIGCAATLVFSLMFSANAVGLEMNSINSQTYIYDDYYVDPKSVAITANGKPKNLINIYLESVETTHISKEYGGANDINYMPALTSLALNNVSFSNLEVGKVGGFRSVPGSGWTMGALLSATSGTPFAFSIESGNNMNRREEFAPGITSIGDILQEKGYQNIFMCGSDATFGGRQKYFKQHGNYKIYDLLTARSEGKLPSPVYHNMFWGYEDKYLFSIAKEQLTSLAASEQPFNLTMLTVDTHPIDGYICSLCQNTYENTTANVIACTDSQVVQFVEWIKQQDFYEDCVIVISGDHLRMDMVLVPDAPIDRRIYNCFINSAVTVSEKGFFGRDITTVDLFPTTLAAMGFTIEGNRLGLGTNAFSSVPTLSEQLGYEYLHSELLKNSDYYFYKFEHPEIKWERKRETD